MSKKTGTYDADVIVIGGGPSGLTLTSLLASNGVKTICIDRDNPAAQIKGNFDGRTIAISYGSRKVLEAGGIWGGLEELSCPIEKIDILDGDSDVLLEFNSHEVGDRTFGWIAEIRDMREALFKRVAALEHAEHMAPTAVTDFTVENDSVTVHLQGGKTLSAPLVIGADGRNSFTREWMGISTRGWTYNQRAIVCTVEHEHPHNNVAVEHFRAEGPFAVLPMTDDKNGKHRSSVVWTEHHTGRTEKSAMDFSEDVFNTALCARFPDSYGTVKLAGSRFTYPLGLIHAHNYIGPRMALVADAAHGIHPIAGQGLNLGFRDIAALAELVIEAHNQGHDPGSESLLDRYQRQRRFDNMAMAGTTDLLTKLFSNDIAPVSLARKAGLRAVSRLPFAKRFFMKQAMGSAGILPSLIKEGQNTKGKAA